MAARALVVYHLAEQRPMMGAFLDALGIAHENGVIQEDDVKPDAEKIGPASDQIAKDFPAADVSLYLNTLLCQDPGTWGGLQDVVQRLDVAAGSSRTARRRHLRLGYGVKTRRYGRVAVRKPVILVTGAGGEIGHGLVTRLAGSSRPIVTLDVAPLDKTLAPLVAREFLGSITDPMVLARVLAEFEVDLVFHLAALLSTRAEFTPTTAHHVNVEGTLNLLEFAQHEGESHGRGVVFVYPSSIAAYGIPDLDDQNPRRPRSRGRLPASDDDVRVQQAVLRTIGPLLRAALQAAGGQHRGAARGFSQRAVSRVDFGHHHALGRHVRLRLGDDSRRGQRRTLRVFRAPGHHDSVHGDARRG